MLEDNGTFPGTASKKKPIRDDPGLPGDRLVRLLSFEM